MLKDTLANTNVGCNHVFVEGKVMANLRTNGVTTDHEKWERGQGIYYSRKAYLKTVMKCVHCGKIR